jgi:hypothetical protein
MRSGSVEAFHVVALCTRSHSVRKIRRRVAGDGRDDALPCGVDHTITLGRVLDRAGVTRPVCVAGSGDDPMEDCADDQGIRPYDQDVINGRLVKLGLDP